MLTKNKIVTATIAIAAFLLSLSTAHAIVDPLSSPNNIYGIHITDDSDIVSAAELVNSNGGDWGYVTLVVQENDKNTQKWQKTFEKLRQNHLIPILRLATSLEGSSWQQPHKHEIGEWISFLNSLNWVTKNRYVVLFNEPNHSKEWGGVINPEEYAEIYRSFYTSLKESSPDFFIIPAGIDTAAGVTDETLSFQHFVSRMHNHDDQIFTIMDGWNSHSYPNPDFTSSPYKAGFGSIRSYLSEVRHLQKYGLKNDIPIFITETGWKHDINASSSEGLNSNTVNQYYKTAYEYIWTDPNIIAITPFILDYTDPPFANFSWSLDENTFVPWYQTVKDIQKIAGAPEQYNKLITLRSYLPQELTVNRTYQGSISVQNIGQKIIGKSDLSTKIKANHKGLDIVIGTNDEDIHPSQVVLLPITINTSQVISDHTITWQLFHQNLPVSPHHTQIISVKAPSVITNFKIWLYQSVHQQKFSTSN